jgi:hypothetical protein
VDFPLQTVSLPEGKPTAHKNPKNMNRLSPNFTSGWDFNHPLAGFFSPFDLGAEDEYNDGLDMNPAETQYKLEAPGLRSWSFRELSICRVAWYTEIE